MRKLALLVLLCAGCGPSASQLAMNRLDRAIFQAMATATPKQQQQVLRMLEQQQAHSDSAAERQLQTLGLLNQAVGNVNGMYHPAEPVAPVIQTTHCSTNPFNGNVTCTTF